MPTVIEPEQLEAAIDERLDDQAEQEQPAPVDVAIPASPPPNAEERLTALEEMEREVAAAESKWRDCKEATKEAKAIYDTAVLQMRSMIRAASNDKNRPLLAAIEKPAEPATDDTCRATTLEQLSINGRIAKALTEAGLTTLGAIADYTREYAITSVKGIGEAAGQEIEDRLTDYWSQNPVASVGPEDEDDDSDLDDEDDE